MKYINKSKRADLSLSINAIVILILAITILGLGLTFVRGLFKQAEGRVSGIIDSGELTSPPTNDNPMTLTPKQITMRNKEQTKVDLAFLNNLGVPKQCKLSILVNDDSGAIKEVNTDALVIGTNKKIKDFITYHLSNVGMDPDKIRLWTLALNGKKFVDNSAPSKPTAGTLVFTASMCCNSDGADLNTDFECDDANTDPAKERIQFTKDFLVTVTT